MTDEVPFHRTYRGARFFENTVPELVRQLERLNENLERLTADKEKKRSDDDEEDAQEPRRDHR